MAMTLRHASVTQWELQPILASSAQQIVQGIYKECQQREINPLFRQRLEAVLTEFWNDELTAQHKLNRVQQAELLRFQNEYLHRSRQRAISQQQNPAPSQVADSAFAVDEISEFYASGGYLFLFDEQAEACTADTIRSLEELASLDWMQMEELKACRRELAWYERVRESGLSEVQVAQETQKRGLRLVLELDKDYKNLHPMLPGENYYGNSCPDDPLSVALYGEDDIPKASCPTAFFSDQRDSSGYGPPRYVTPHTVASLSQFFSETTFADQVAKQVTDAELDLNWAGDAEFNRLKALYTAAAKCDYGILVFFV